MLALPRSLARTFRAVCLWAHPRQPRAPVVVDAGPDGLWLSAPEEDVTVAYWQAGAYPAARVALPLAALADIEGGTDALAALEVDADGKVVTVRWQDAGVPQVKEYDAFEETKLPACPPTPTTFAAVDPALLEALTEATRSATHDPVRFQTDRMQLRGQTGVIVATDGRQLLWQGGFSFPWEEELLVPASPVFACKELRQGGALEIGRTESHVTLRASPWLVHLRIDKDGRFPRAEHVLPKPTSTWTCWLLDPEDAVFLAKALPRLPGKDDDCRPVTIDLSGAVVVRARSADKEDTAELVLARSRCTGPAVRLHSDRQYLLRAAEMGLSEVHIQAADKPVLARGGGRQYLWVPLLKEHALAPTEGATRIASGEVENTAHSPQPRRRDQPATSPKPSGGTNGAHAESTAAPSQANSSGGILAVIEEAEALKAVLRDAYERTSRLIAALRRQKKESQVVRNTLASLRQLQDLAG